MSDTSSRSSQGPSPALTDTSAPDDVITPLRVPSTARRREASRVEDGTAALSRRSSRFADGDTPSRLPSPPQRVQRKSSHNAQESFAVPRRRSRGASSTDTLRQRLHSTVAVAEAEAVRVARDFSMEMYRALHQRRFASLHEELDFLRKDFVASRRTLALLHEDNLRLERELLARVQQVEELQTKLEEAYKEVDESTALPRSSRHSSAAQGAHDAYEVPVLWAATTNAEEEHSTAPPTALSPGHTEVQDAHTSGDEGKEVAASKEPFSSDQANKEEPLSSSANVLPKPSVPPSPLRSRPARKKPTPLAFYAHTTGRKAALRAGGEEAVDLQELIRDLRANLARRDTALNETQMELAALQHERQSLRTELTDVQAQLLQAKQQRDALQSTTTALEEQRATREREREVCEAQLLQLGKERDDLQQRLTTAELLYEHTGARREGREPADVWDADGSAALRSGDGTASSSASPASSDRYLRDQLQLYRAKWQAAEDEVEHLNKRLSELQRQLVSTGPTGAAPPPSTEQINDKPNSDSVLAITAQQRAEHAAELETLRRQHREQLQLHAEEVQRLQRRLDRAQENAAFHEDQLRQQRQDDTRQHHREVQTLQTQLRTAQGELVKAQQDREHLARELRRSTEQETTVEVLRSQVAQLKQRLGEVGAELAQLRGREKETSLNVQRACMARAKAEHDAETTQEELSQKQKEVDYLQEEVQLLREQLGVREASAPPPWQRSNAPPVLSAVEATVPAVGGENRTPSVAATAAAGMDGGGDAAALASELKGYVSLMRINTTLQRRIEELEAQVASLQAALQTAQNSTAGVVAAASISAVPASPVPAPAADEVEQKREMERLHAELAKSMQTQRDLLLSCAAAEKDRRLLAEDNVTLASGIELLEKQLRKLQVTRRAERTHSRHRESALLRQLSTRPSTKEKRARRHASEPKQTDLTPPPPSHDAASLTEQSRLRQRLQTARAQDQRVLKDKLTICLDETTSIGPTTEQQPSSCPICAPVGSRCPNCCRCCCCVTSCGCHRCVSCNAPRSASPSPLLHESVCRHHDAGAPLPSASPLASPCIGSNSSNAVRTECVCASLSAETAAAAAAAAAAMAPPSIVSSVPPTPPPASVAQSPAPLLASAVQETPEAEKAIVETRPPPLPGTAVDAVSLSGATAAVTATAMHSRRDASSSPLHSPRRHIHGSVLPPVLYPSLVLRTRA